MVPFALLTWNAAIVMKLFGQDPVLAAAAQSYLRWMTFAQIFAFWHFVLSEFLAAHMRPRVTLVISIGSIFLNLLGDYLLMFGHYGLPRLGLDGAGIASAIVMTTMFLAILSFVLIDRRLRRYRLLGRFWRTDWQKLWEIFRLGVPIATSNFAESGMFLAMTLLMGFLGTAPLAAHTIAAQCCGLVYMVPYGIGQAATVRVGRAIGAGNRAAARAAGLECDLHRRRFRSPTRADFLVPRQFRHRPLSRSGCGGECGDVPHRGAAADHRRLLPVRR